MRHTRVPAKSCFLPDLTRFTGSRCAGPDPQRLVRVVPLGGPSLERGFSPPDVGLGYRAPRAPRLARSTEEDTRRRVPSCPLEGCESGRIGTLGKRVWGNSPWVRIPLPPPLSGRHTTRLFNHTVDKKSGLRYCSTNKLNKEVVVDDDQLSRIFAALADPTR